MILSDKSIRRLVGERDMIMPFAEEYLQPASYDCRLKEVLAFGHKHECYVINPKEFVLGGTLEKISLPANVVARIEGKSSLARKGLMIHTAGFIDPGFSGYLTLEITNHSEKPIDLIAGQLIAQVAFQWMDDDADRPYGHPDLGSHYQNQEGVTRSHLK